MYPFEDKESQKKVGDMTEEEFLATIYASGILNFSSLAISTQRKFDSHTEADLEEDSVENEASRYWHSWDIIYPCERNGILSVGVNKNDWRGMPRSMKSNL